MKSLRMLLLLALFLFLFTSTEANAGNYSDGIALVTSKSYENFDLDECWCEAVSISGNYSIVGQTPTSTAYIFSYNGSSWLEQAVLESPISNPQYTAGFGHSVAIDGDYAVIGAPFSTYTDNDEVISGGEVFVFIRNGTFWNYHSTLQGGQQEPADDRFGYSISISGDYLVVGSPHFNDDGDENQGVVFVYKRDGTNWTKNVSLVTSNENARHDFGRSVSISNDTIIVGSVNDYVYGGAAHVFVNNGAQWVEQQILEPEEHHTDAFGYAVSISGNYAVIGDWRDGGGFCSDTSYDDYTKCKSAGETWTRYQDNGEGSAYIFVRENDVWEQHSKISCIHLPDCTDQPFFGSSVSISNDFLVIGAKGPMATIPHKEEFWRVGSVFVFIRNETNWNLLETFDYELNRDDPLSSRERVSSVSVSHGSVIVGHHVSAPYIFAIDRDTDGDGIIEGLDLCPDSNNTIVDATGCSESQKDDDNDGVMNDRDECPDTVGNVTESGCSESQKDDDNDGVMNNQDECPDTLSHEEIDSYGCSASQRDSDFDGVYDNVDQCSDNFRHDIVDSETGCTVKSHILISAGDNVTIKIGDTVQFNGAGSDEYHEIILYEWDFNSDGLYEWSSDENGRTTNIYNSADNYVATFRITCSGGYTVTDTITITVKEDEDEEKSEKPTEEELDNGGGSGILPSLSFVYALGSLVLLAIARRRD